MKQTPEISRSSIRNSTTTARAAKAINHGDSSLSGYYWHDAHQRYPSNRSIIVAARLECQSISAEAVRELNRCRRDIRRGFVKAITKAAHGANQHGIRRVGFHFLPKPQNIDIHGAVGDGTVLTPDRIEQLFPAKYDAGPAHQVFEEAKFRSCERQLTRVQTHAATVAIQFQIARTNQPDGRSLATELRLDARDQLANEKRLHDVVVRAKLQAEDTVGFGCAGRQKNHRNVREFRMAADGFADIKPVGIRQHDIENQQVRPLAAAQLDRAPSGLGAREAEALLFEVILQQRVEVRIV